MSEPASVLQEIHSPVCPTCGAVLCPAHGHEFPTESDVPFELRRELMRASVAKGISYYWLCAIYRQGLIDQRQPSALSDETPDDLYLQRIRDVRSAHQRAMGARTV